jgi:8-oxo-dGTP pyrophosphatase MutT (NUDIX family)
MQVKQYSAGVVVVRRAETEWLFLILRCYRNWDFPKGRVENGESFVEAATREAAEETSIQDLEFNWGELYCDTAIYANGKVARYFVAQTKLVEINLPINPELGEAEHHEYKWVTFGEAEKTLPPRLLPILQWATKCIS